MEESNDERDSPLRRQILESSKKNASDPSKRGISYNEMADIEQYLLQERGIKTIDERVDYLKGININDIDPQLTKLGLKSRADRDQMVKRENELKAVLKNNPLAASLQQMKSTVERINSTPVMPLPNFPEIKSPLESIEKAAWERHNQLRDLQQDTYDVLAAIADSNQNLLNEQRRNEDNMGGACHGNNTNVWRSYIGNVNECLFDLQSCFVAHNSSVGACLDNRD